MLYMLNLQNLLRGWADALLAWLGVTPVHNDAWDRWVAFLLVVLVAVAFDFVCRRVLARGVRHVVRRTAVTWDDELFSDAVLGRACHVASALLLLIVLPVIFDAQSEAPSPVSRKVGDLSISTETIRMMQMSPTMPCAVCRNPLIGLSCHAGRVEAMRNAAPSRALTKRMTVKMK